MHHQNIIRAGFYEVIHSPKAFALSCEHIKPLQLTPIKFPFRKFRQLRGGHPDLGTTVCPGLITIINTFKPYNDRLALPATLFKLCRNTLTVQIENPVGIAKYSVNGVGEGINL